jgi:hypothetical protein
MCKKNSRYIPDTSAVEVFEASSDSGYWLGNLSDIANEAGCQRTAQ